LDLVVKHKKSWKEVALNLKNNQHRDWGGEAKLKKHYANLKGTHSKPGKYGKTRTYNARKVPKKKKNQSKDAYDQELAIFLETQQAQRKLFENCQNMIQQAEADEILLDSTKSQTAAGLSQNANQHVEARRETRNNRMETWEAVTREERGWRRDSLAVVRRIDTRFVLNRKLLKFHAEQQQVQTLMFGKLLTYLGIDISDVRIPEVPDFSEAAVEEIGIIPKDSVINSEVKSDEEVNTPEELSKEDTDDATAGSDEEEGNDEDLIL